MSELINDVTRRHDFVLLLDVADGNPNGDPDAGNLPRVDPETMQGLITDVCLKRKVRNYVDAIKSEDQGYGIYIQNKGYALNALHKKAHEALGIKSTGSKQNRADVDKARTFMCENYYDVRTFGAVMTTGVNCGQVRGPLQLTFARSIDQIVPLDLSITRIAITKEEDIQKVDGDEGESEGKNKVTEMGRKALVPYGLYKGYGFFNPFLAKQTGFSADDLALFWEALRGMWEIDRSASRGLMALRGLYVFSHESGLGSAPANDLFDLVGARRKGGVEAPRRFSDYTVSVNDSALPAGVTLTRLVG